MMFHRRIQCCWLFPCQLFHMQLSPLLTLPLMLDHRWKSSSNPADASDFHECFLFNSQRENSSRTSNFTDVRKPATAFFLVLSSLFFSTITRIYCAATGLKKRKEGRRKANTMGVFTIRKKWNMFVSFACRPFSSSNFQSFQLRSPCAHLTDKRWAPWNTKWLRMFILARNI